MRKTRVFVQSSLQPGQESVIEGDAAHHLINVLRVKIGQAIVVFNGDGGCFDVEIVGISKNLVVIIPRHFHQDNRESPLQLTLIQGISRGQHMDYTVQKAVELGVTAIVPVFTTFSNVKLTDERASKRLDHWQKIIIGACEQSGRNIVPVIRQPVALEEWVSADTNRLRLVLHPDASDSLSAIKMENSGLSLLCGPEGGLSDQELAICLAGGYEKVTIGPRILRTETAALAAIAICQSRFGDMR
jgi:16S rRNA (uracil1498-N3)-methyltransferase